MAAARARFEAIVFPEDVWRAKTDFCVISRTDNDPWESTWMVIVPWTNSLGRPCRPCGRACRVEFPIVRRDCRWWLLTENPGRAKQWKRQCNVSFLFWAIETLEKSRISTTSNVERRWFDPTPFEIQTLHLPHPSYGCLFFVFFKNSWQIVLLFVVFAIAVLGKKDACCSKEACTRQNRDTILCGSWSKAPVRSAGTGTQRSIARKKYFIFQHKLQHTVSHFWKPFPMAPITGKECIPNNDQKHNRSLSTSTHSVFFCACMHTYIHTWQHCHCISLVKSADKLPDRPRSNRNPTSH